MWYFQQGREGQVGQHPGGATIMHNQLDRSLFFGGGQGGGGEAIHYICETHV